MGRLENSLLVCIGNLISSLQITVLAQTTGVKMAGAVQSAGVVATGVAARGGGVAGFVIKVNMTGCSFTVKEYHGCTSHTTLLVFCTS